MAVEAPGSGRGYVLSSVLPIGHAPQKKNRANKDMIPCF